jgi:hypothetical protein
MRDTIDMAREVYGAHTEWTEAQLERLKQFEALVRADERSVGREACAKVCDDLLPPAEEIQRLSALVRAQQITIDKLDALLNEKNCD